MDPHSFFADPDPAALLNADPDPAVFFLMRIRLQPNKIFNKLPNKKDGSKQVIKKTMELVQIIYFIFRNKILVSTNFHAFFLFFLLKFFTPGSGSRRENGCGSGSTAQGIV